MATMVEYRCVECGRRQRVTFGRGDTTGYVDAKKWRCGRCLDRLFGTRRGA